MKYVLIYVLISFTGILDIVLFSSCGKKERIEEEGVEPEEDDSLNVSASIYTYSKVGVFTLAVEKEIATVASNASLLEKIKSAVTEVQPLFSPETLKQWDNDTLWVQRTEDIVAVKDGKLVIGDVLRFSQLVQQKKFALIHYLALSYYDKHLIPDRKSQIKNHYSEVKELKYKQVYQSNGIKLVPKQTPDAYKDARTYFAESAEAYLYENDYYPFDYQELERYDNSMFAFLVSILGKRTVSENAKGITLPPTSLKQWLSGTESDLDLYYNKYLDANGLPILSSRFVSDDALVQTQYIINTMLKRIPESLEEMKKARFRIGIIGAYENVTDMPENRMMPIWWPGTDWDARGRGYGATEWLPLMSCGEENIIKIPNYTERYPFESILVHEFAHNVDFGLRKGRPSFTVKLLAAYNNAKSKGLWAGTYSMENDAEYFAEGAQAWFDTCNMYVLIDGKRTKLKTREQLASYDPVLYDLLSSIFPEDKLTGYHFTYE